MEKVDAAVRKMASKPTSVAAFTLATALLPWILAFAPPVLRSLQVGFATEVWRLLVARLTPPVLFLLLNVVILSIWISSSPPRPLESEEATATAAAASAGLAAAPGPGAAGKLPPALVPRKDAILVLPPLVSPPPKCEVQKSVFSTADVGDVVFHRKSFSTEEMVVVQPEQESQEAAAKLSPAAAAEKELKVSIPPANAEKELKISPPPPPLAAPAKWGEKELKIPPPPPPSFLLERAGRGAGAKLKVSTSAKTRSSTATTKQPVDRQNSAPARTEAKMASAEDSSSSSSGSPTSSSSAAAAAVPAAAAPSTPIVFNDDQFEAVIAKFYAQLRLQKD